MKGTGGSARLDVRCRQALLAALFCLVWSLIAVCNVLRWCCSGTPISTEVTDFQGQFKFLGVSPFDTPIFFTNYVRPLAHNAAHGYTCSPLQQCP